MKIHAPVEQKLENGCRFITIPVEDTKKVAASISFRTGMEYFSLNKQQLPHLLEHLLLNDHNGEDINDKLSHLGSYANGSTDYVTVNLTVTAPMRTASETICTLLETVFDNDVDKSFFVKEKSVVIREVRERFDGIQPSIINYLLRQGYEKMFPESWEATIADIENIQYDDVQTLYKEQICPQNMTVIIVGEPTMVNDEKLRASLESIPRSTTFKQRNRIALSKPQSFYQPMIINLGSDTALNLCFDSPITNDPMKRTARTATDFLLFSGQNALVDKELRKIGSVYSTDFDGLIVQDHGIAIFNALVERKLAPQAITKIFDSIYRVANGEVSENELQSLKNSTTSSLENDINNTEDVLAWYMEDLLRERPTSSPEEEISRLDRLTVQDIAKATTDTYVDSVIYWAISSSDSAFWAGDIDKLFKALKTKKSKNDRETYLASIQEQLEKAYQTAPERVGYFWAAYYALSYFVLLILLFVPTLAANNNYISYFAYGFETTFLMVAVPILQAASGGLYWLKGAEEWLADRIAIIVSGVAAIIYGTTLFVTLDGMQTMTGHGWHGWILLLPTIFYFIAVPIAVLSVIRLSIHDKFKK